MEIAKNREEYGLIKTDLPKQKIEDKKSLVFERLFYPGYVAMA